jgi:hypothetical protein
MAPPAAQGPGPVDPQMQAQMQPQMQAPPGMAEGGLAQLDFAAPDYAGGGLVSFAEGGAAPAAYTPPNMIDLTRQQQEAIRGLAPLQMQDTEAYRAQLRERKDPEAERKRAELAGLFQSLGGVRPGMTPLEALAQGFSTTGTSMLASEDQMREQELERLKALADFEQIQNKLTREELDLAQRYASAQATLQDTAEKRRVDMEMSQLDRASREKIAAAANAISMASAAMQQSLARDRLAFEREQAAVEAYTRQSGGSSVPGIPEYLQQRFPQANQVLGTTASTAGPQSTPAPLTWSQILALDRAGTSGSGGSGGDDIDELVARYGGN